MSFDRKYLDGILTIWKFSLPLNFRFVDDSCDSNNLEFNFYVLVIIVVFLVKNC